MTNSIAIFLGLLIIGFFALDYFVLHLDALSFLFRHMINLIDKMSFWH